MVPNNIPRSLIEPILNGTQKTIWHRSQANNNDANQAMNQGMIQWAVIGGAVRIADLGDSDLVEPEEDDETDTPEEDATADEGSKVRIKKVE